jgi:hypothetical protein
MSIKSWLAGLAAAVAALGGAALAIGPAAFASTHPASHTGTTVRSGTHLMAGLRLQHTVSPQLAPDIKLMFRGESGYAVAADRGRRIRFVSADFTVPTLNCATSPLGSAGANVEQTVSLDGFNDNTAEVVGVLSNCDNTGAASYIGFSLMAPRGGLKVINGINAGDAIQASVYFTGSRYRLILKDVTTGKTTTVFQRCPRRSRCLNKSAAVLTMGGGQGSDLADFGVIHYTGVRVTSVGGRHGTLAPLRRYWQSAEITMIDRAHHRLAVPSALHNHGHAFSVTWKRPS